MTTTTTHYLTDDREVITADQAASRGYADVGATSLWLPDHAGWADPITAATVRWESLDGYHSKKFRGRGCVAKARAYRDAEWPGLADGEWTTDDGVARYAGIRYTTA